MECYSRHNYVSEGWELSWRRGTAAEWWWQGAPMIWWDVAQVCCYGLTRTPIRFWDAFTIRTLLLSCEMYKWTYREPESRYNAAKEKWDVPMNWRATLIGAKRANEVLEDIANKGKIHKSILLRETFSCSFFSDPHSPCLETFNLKINNQFKMC